MEWNRITPSRTLSSAIVRMIGVCTSAVATSSAVTAEPSENRASDRTVATIF